jgi:P-type conjugative transfer protein TrbJ
MVERNDAFVTAFILHLAPPVKAQFGGGIVVCSNCSTSLTQGTMKITQDLAYAKQLLQYAIQVQQLADAVQNTAHGGRATLTNISADLNQLANIVQGGQALAYSPGNQDVLFRQTYPGYQTLGPARGLPPPAGTYASNMHTGHGPAWRQHGEYFGEQVYRGGCSQANRVYWARFEH